ncbi:MAG: PQQ-binding-like beta-propeller repeat protein [Pirellulales bacterium]|nr:PQQ-binding-like beta-propeller repeat protein [Pirellulales bacterium]
MSPGKNALAAILAAGGLIAGWGSGLVAQQVQFQVQLGQGRTATEGRPSKVQLVTDRVAARGIKRAEQSIAQGEFSQAVTFLDSVLGSDEDLFVEVGEEGRVAGLKELARELLRDLPPGGRQAYEATFGPVAQRQLAEAVAAGDRAALDRVAGRYFYTSAGYEAALLAAMDEADAGRHLAAALSFEQLLAAPEAVARFDPQLSIRAATSWLAAGDQDRAEAILEKLLARGEQSIHIAGREYRLEAGAQPLEWLRSTVGEPAARALSHEDQWLTYRGNAARNGASSGGLPHIRVRWQVRLLGHPALDSLVENFVADLARSGNMAPVASYPLAAGDYILTRTPQGLLAIDFRTGKRVWRSEPQQDAELLQLMQSGANGNEGAANPEPARSFARRLWEDYLYGVTSSDGSLVYMIRDLPMPTAQDFDVAPWMAVPQGEVKNQFNRLSAYELATQGKLVWEIDGASAPGPLAGVFFLGAPLPVGESLYALAEIKGAIHLIALDAASGEFQWQQPLAYLENSVQVDFQRRMQAAMPSYAAGMLVCPTSAGVVLGVDLAKHSLAWAYQYEIEGQADVNFRGQGDDNLGRLAHRWFDGAATIVGDRLLLTPPDSHELHAIDLRTGKLLWKHKRGDFNRLAAVDQDRILLTGNRTALALSLSDGKPAWAAELQLSPGVMPSGTGFLSEGKYYLPLTSSEVIAVDMSDGTIASRTVSRDGLALGNLICHRGAVISQNGVFLNCYDQIDVLREASQARLAQQPDDVEALRTLGEIAYNDGRLSEAISLLERAYRAAPQDVAASEVLAECLVAALDEDFAAFRRHLPLLKELEGAGVAQRMVILRLEAQGLLHEGDVLASAAACLELFRIADDADQLLKIGRDHEATVARWVQSQLADAWDRATPQQRIELESQIRSALATGEQQPEGEQLARAVAFFGSLPLAEPLKLHRARELNDSGDKLASQQLLLELESSADAATRAEAIARLAGQLHDAKLHSLASRYDRELAGALADVTCLPGATGRQLVDKWQSLPGAAAPRWPGGRVDVREAPAANGVAPRVPPPAWAVRFERCDAILGLSSAQLSARGGELVMLDNYGREFFRSSFEPETQMYFRQAVGNMYAVARGSLVVASLGRQITALNTLGGGGNRGSAQLWKVNLGSQLDYTQGFYGNRPGSGAARPGSFRAPRAMDEDKWVGVIGPVTTQGVVFQDQRRLVCVDAVTGEIRWSRTDVPQGCDLFGDERYVIAAPSDSGDARIYSAIDGREVARTRLPPWPQQLVALGRNLILWKSLADRTQLSSLNPLTGATAWQYDFAANAQVDVDMGRYVAVVEPQGRAIVVDAANGARLVDHPVPATPRIDEIHVAVGRDSFLVAAKHPRAGGGSRNVQPIHMLDSQVMDGHIYLFDRESGAMRWNRPAEVAQQSLLLTQPADLPFIVFAGLTTDANSGNARPLCKVLILDKATGRTLYQKDDLPQNGNYCVPRVTDGANGQAAVELAGRTILLQFTDQRRPPEPPPLAEVESGGEKGTGGLMGIIFGLGN